MTQAADTFNFELVSPERRLLSEPAKMAIVPGEEGHFGVLPGHSALVATIKPGVVEVHSAAGDEVRRIFIAGGFADVTPTSCTILAEEAVSVTDLNAEVLDKEISHLKEDLSLAQNDLDRARIKRKLVLAEAKRAAVAA